MIYDTVPASYLATSCLKVLSEIMCEKYLEAASSIGRDFYMDDFLDGTETREEAIILLNSLVTVMAWH